MLIGGPSNGKRSRTLLAVPLLIASLVMSSCAQSPGARGPEGGSTTVAAPKSVRMAILDVTPPSLTDFGGSSTGGTALEHYFIFHAGLTRYDLTGKVITHIAEKVPTLEDGDWKILPEGGMEVTWKLRPGVLWHDGTPLTAEDFAFGFQVVTDPALSAASRGDVPSIADARATDPQTLVVLWKTQSIFGNNNAFDGIPAIPRHLFRELYLAGDMAAFENSFLWSVNWVGLGPYRVSDFVVGSHVEGTAFDQFFLGRPKIDRVTIFYRGDANAMVAGVLAGDIDIIPNGGSIDVPQMAAVRQSWGTEGGLTLANPKGVRTLYLQMRDPANPWARDVRVRQGLLHALDREGIIEALVFGLVARADYQIPPEDPVYALAEERRLPRYPYDPARAERLFADAGFTRGADRMLRSSAGQPLWIDVMSSSGGANVQEATAVAAQWTAAGAQSSPTPYSTSVDARQVKHEMQGAVVWPWNFSIFVSRNLIASETGTAANRWRGSNWGGYSNPAYEALYKDLADTLDAGKRTEALFQITGHIAEELPVLPLFYHPDITISRKGLEGPGAVPAVQRASSWNIHLWDLKER
jgi:peptide/nickel transport system substrate-binding protein